VPDEVVRRRYARGLTNFFELYRPRAHYWQMYNGVTAGLIAEGMQDTYEEIVDSKIWNDVCLASRVPIMSTTAREFPAALRDRDGIERACILAARDAARIHRAYNVPLIGMRDGQVAEISADELDAQLDEREAKLNAKIAAKQQASADPLP
jgi:hypothetical protein